MAAGTQCGAIIKKFWGTPLTDYLASLIPKRDPHYRQSNEYREMVAEAIDHQARIHEYPRRSEILMQFMEEPVLQMADHADLLYDGAVFLNNFLHQVAARERNQKFLISQQCSTVRGLMGLTDLYGPAYLHVDADVLNVFGLSKKKLKYGSIAGLRDVQFLFTPTGTKVPAYTQIQLPDLLESLRGRSFVKASEAIRWANIQIWDGFRMRAKKPLIQFNEDLSSKVWGIAIDRGNNALHSLLFQPVIRSSFLAAKKAVLASSANLVLRDTSDFFHYRRGNELKPTRLVETSTGPIFVDGTNGNVLSIPINEIGIKNSLEQGDLFPDLIMSYIALSIFPEVVALGGSSQQEYLPIIVKVILETHAKTAFLTAAEHERLSNSNTSRLSGAALIALTPNQRRVIGLMNSKTDLDSFESELLYTTLGPSLGDFDYYRYFLDMLYKKGTVTVQ